MNLQTDIEKLYEDNSNYSNPGHATNLAEALNALSKDLYTDSKRFIYELLQNADDSTLSDESINVSIKLFDEYLVVAHSGKAFDSRDLQGICNINNGTKRDSIEKTGYKGIGFKSVFGQSEDVTIFTDNEYFRFDSAYDFGWKDEWDNTQEIWEQNNERKFLYPWQIIPIYTGPNEVPTLIDQFLQNGSWKVATIIKMLNKDETKSAIHELAKNVNMFLFLKNISNILFEMDNPNDIEIDRSIDKQIILRSNNIVKAQWLIHTISLNVPRKLKEKLDDERNIPEKLLAADTIEISLAAKINNDQIMPLSADEKLLYAYLPTDEKRYSLPVLVNTSFLTTANRESLHADSKWNQWLFYNIAIELFKWIAILVKEEFQNQGYKLIPLKSGISDELSTSYNKGISNAVEKVPFLITQGDQLVTIKDSIVDFTFLSEKEFIGAESIKLFIDNPNTVSSKQFVKKTGFGNRFKKLGASCFEWEDMPSFLAHKSFLDKHSVGKNIDLIKHLKHLCDPEKMTEITIDKLRKWSFILSHKMYLTLPQNVYIPTSDDDNWNSPEGELLYLHPDILTWLYSDQTMRIWIESLGVIEKTDISYIEKTLIPNADNFITPENAIATIQNLFSLYKKNELNELLLDQLSSLKLLTLNGNLQPANKCYLSNFYLPRLKLEDILDDDIYVSTEYLKDPSDKDEWKRFFKMLCVKDGIIPIHFEKKCKKENLINIELKSEYFEENDKKFSPFVSTFMADTFKHIALLDFLLNTNNYSFAKAFWDDVISNVSPSELSQPVTAFWGYEGRLGRITGDEVDNYIPWFVRNVDCLPALTKECKKASAILINSVEIKLLSGKYLPVFDGVELSPDWASFLNFRTHLVLVDYLELLTKIALDTDERGKPRIENVDRIQSIYKELLENCVNWSADEIQTVNEWSGSGILLNDENEFTICRNLNYFLDGSNSIFQGQLLFLNMNAENKRHPNIEKLLNYFQITVLKQCNFELFCENRQIGQSLKDKLLRVIPYFKSWIEKECDEQIIEQLDQFEVQFGRLEIYEDQVLHISYGSEFKKRVHIHLDRNQLYVTTPWDSNTVLLQLSETLCNYFQVRGYDKELDFLLRSSDTEIREYFNEETIEIPSNISPILEVNEIDNRNPITQEYLVSLGISTLEEYEKAINNSSILSEFYHTSTPTYDMFIYAQELIDRAVTNIIEHLKTLGEYDCDDYESIAPTILGGIKKNGIDIFIIARPSDNNQVILFYPSEFDTLDYAGTDAELWYENDADPPQKITLGSILKGTGINRIPVQ